MAGLMHMSKIAKMNNKGRGMVPVNLESGNFNPPYLTVMDGLVDAMSNNKGSQRFEKAISGGYIGEIFKTVFCENKIRYDFDGEALSKIMNNPQGQPEEYVNVANWLFARSANLVAASLAGLIQVLLSHDETVKTVCLAADGSVFWKSSKNYHQQVAAQLKALLPDDVVVTFADEEKMSEANLIGSAIAAMS
jgi:hexokinase